MSRLAAITQAVAELIAGKSFTLPSGATISVERTYTPPVSLEESDTNVHVYVWPSAREAQRHTRQAFEDLVSVTVGVVRRIPDRADATAARTAVDEILKIVDEMVAYLAFHVASPFGLPLQITQSPPYSQADIVERGLIISAITAQYREEFVSP